MHQSSVTVFIPTDIKTCLLSPPSRISIRNRFYNDKILKSLIEFFRVSPDAPYLTKIVFHIAPGVELSCSMGVLPVFVTLISAEPSLISGRELATSRRLSKERNEVVQDYFKHHASTWRVSKDSSLVAHTYRQFW